ncbi:uncharacterized protein LOC131146722 [Malania oleifera]|uniref:uncharacterized protein LOC131146722 n=1 Tax=Malania oleifera TaxID=397392 RepID=UPI0025ADAB18|nr:uncharacterized protein LOC131146722 [Malania oleifera]
MQLQGAPDAIMCRVFATTLKGTARDWYRTLRPRSVGSFQGMEQMFIGHFLSSRRVAKTTGHLMSMVQGDRETLKNFMHRFNTATLEIRNLDMGVALATLTTALQPGSFLYSLRKKTSSGHGGVNDSSREIHKPRGHDGHERKSSRAEKEKQRQRIWRRI